MTEKGHPIQRPPILHPIQPDNSPKVAEEDHTVEATQTTTLTHTYHKPMIIEEDPDLSTPTRNNSASFQTLQMITQETIQEVAFDVMTHHPSALTANKIKQPLNKYSNLKHYCTLVIHPTSREIINKYSKPANDPEKREVWKTAFGK